MPKQNRQAGIHLHKTGPKTNLQYEYYWILIARNGKTIARSSETYKRKAGAVKSIAIAAAHFDNNNHYYDHTTGVVADKHPDLVVY